MTLGRRRRYFRVALTFRSGEAQEYHLVLSSVQRGWTGVVADAAEWMRSEGLVSRDLVSVGCSAHADRDAAAAGPVLGDNRARATVGPGGIYYVPFPRHVAAGDSIVETDPPPPDTAAVLEVRLGFEVPWWCWPGRRCSGESSGAHFIAPREGTGQCGPRSHTVTSRGAVVGRREASAASSPRSRCGWSRATLRPRRVLEAASWCSRGGLHSLRLPLG